MKNSSPRGTVRPGPGHHKQYGALAGWRAVRGGGGTPAQEDSGGAGFGQLRQPHKQSWAGQPPVLPPELWRVARSSGP